MSVVDKPLPKVSDGEKEDTEMMVLSMKDDDDLLHCEPRKTESLVTESKGYGYGGGGGRSGPSSLLSIPSSTENGKGYGLSGPNSAMSSGARSDQYEEIGPSSVTSLPSSERREKHKALGIFTKTDAHTGITTKWRVKRRAGYKLKEKREVTSREGKRAERNTKEGGVAEMAEGVVSDDESSDDEDDDRFGDAQDRVSCLGGVVSSVESFRVCLLFCLCCWDYELSFIAITDTFLSLLPPKQSNR